MSEIDYHSKSLSKNDKQKIFEKITNNNNVTSVALSSVKLDDEDCQNLANAILANKNITKLNVSWGEFTNVGFALITNALQKIGNVVDLNLQYIPKNCTTLVENLLENNLLSGLIISSTHNETTKEQKQTMLAALSANESLVSLEIGSYFIGRDNTNALLDIIKKHPNIKTVNLGSSFPNCGEDVLNLLAMDKLDYFEKTHNSYDDAFATKIAEVISKTQRLKTLVMHYNNWSAAGINTLLKALNNSDSLNSLDIHTKNFSSCYVAELNKAIKKSLAPLDLAFLKSYNRATIELNMDEFQKPSMLDNFCKFIARERKSVYNLSLKLNNNNVKMFIKVLENITTPFSGLDIISPDLEMKNLIKLLILEAENKLIEKFEISGQYSEEIINAIRLKLEAGVKAKQIYLEYFNDDIMNMDNLADIDAAVPEPKDKVTVFIEKLAIANNENPADNQNKQIIIEKTLALIGFLEGDARLAEINEILVHNPAIIAVIGGEIIGDFFFQQKDYTSALSYFMEAQAFAKIAKTANKLDVLAKQQKALEPMQPDVLALELLDEAEENVAPKVEWIMTKEFLENLYAQDQDNQLVQVTGEEEKKDEGIELD